MIRQWYAFRIQANANAVCLEDIAHRCGNIFIFPPNQPRRHLDNRDIASEAMIHLGEFQPNITSADDDEVLGQEVEIHHRRVRQKWNFINSLEWGNRGSSTNIDENLVSFEHVIIDHHTSRGLKASMTLNDGTFLKSS